MFRSIAHQIEHDQNNYEKYRKLAVDYIKNLDTNTKYSLNEYVKPFYKNIDDYIEKMSKNKEWGDHITIQALANVLKRRIIIYQLNTNDYVANQNNEIIIEPRTFRTHEKLPITDIDIYLGHIGEKHYISLIPI